MKIINEKVKTKDEFELDIKISLDRGTELLSNDMGTL